MPQTAAPRHTSHHHTSDSNTSQTQPPTATTPRFRHQQKTGRHTPSQSSSGQFNHTLSIPGVAHRRQNSVQSALNSPLLVPKSPGGTVLQSIRKTASIAGFSLGRPTKYDQDDEVRGVEDEEGFEDEAEKRNGTRVCSYVTIDWIHDAIKESTRVRRLRHNSHRSMRGAIANSWDRFQGWLVVTIIGIVTAVIAFLIIRAEMALFDLKEGFCSTSWGTAKRFCCAPKHHRLPGSGEEDCGDWIEWGEFFSPEDRHGPAGNWFWGRSEFIAYGVVALGLATLASCMTVYLSSSAHSATSKDSNFLIPVPSEEDITSATQKTPTERQPLLDASFHTEPLDVGVRSEAPRKTMYYAAGSGIPEIKTILSGFVIHGYLGGWTLLTKSVGLALSVASGLSLGKEGPLVHISCCVGNIVSRLFVKFECNEAKRREVLSAACAAGVAVAFGAPIGGVLFSLEEVSYYFPPKVMWRSFWCAAVAAITLKSLNPFGNGSLVLFAVTYTKQYHYWEYSIFVLLGIFGGVYGAIFSRLNILWSRNVRQGTWVGRHPIIEVMLVTLLTTAVSFLNPYCRMGGTELVASLFAECKNNSSNPLCAQHPHEIASVISTIGFALLIKGALTIITFGIKLPAGIFIPSLVVGACFGRIIGLTLEWLEFAFPDLPIFGVCTGTDCIVPGLYAMVGAAATLAGVTRTTVSLAVIVIELTASLNYVVPIMLGVLVAKTVADGLEKKGIYDLVIDLNQLPFLDSKHEYLWGGRRAIDVADHEVPFLRADKVNSVRRLTGQLLALVRTDMADTGFPLLVKENSNSLRIVGFLGMNELEHALRTLQDEPEAELQLMPNDASRQQSTMSIFSFAESVNDRYDPYDISRYVDRAPITVQKDSPLELVQQLFVKLGASQLLVVDHRGCFKGMITKKAWLRFLSELEEKSI
ncbi:hypothetical protein TREMEDRAFT_34025 [Tremella mesenterica DSM 1558]|nr:uncharacterized protein TREMEDRAFT_34025 [Tremella mesenterica DSM 1558]EIW67300.1 hypothetical protein TREMEDRAFT_34025 [Tremella mesenterica DSM 1558]